LLSKYLKYYKAFINDIIIFLDIVIDYLKYLKEIFELFTKKNFIISLKKLYISYLNVELFSFRVDFFSFIITVNRVEVIRKLDFLNNFKTLETFINIIGFLKYLIL